MVEKWGLRRPMWVDDLQGSTHTAYGRLPNMVYLLRRRGRIYYRANWTDARTLRVVLEQLCFEQVERKARRRMTPFYAEWEAERVNDRPAFLEGMLQGGGERAVREFIDAARHLWGPSGAGPLERWWQARQQTP